MKIETWPIANVKPYDQNPRVNDSAVDAVVASIKEFGWRQPIVVDGEGVIIVGHTRHKAALKMELTEVPVHVATELSPAQVKAYRIADNQSANIAEWNIDLLGLELAGLKEMEFDLGLLGFDADELADLMGTQINPGLTDPIEVPEVPEQAITQPGDLWLLDDHRLLCGDSTNPAHVARLMDGNIAAMAFSDPPWNVSIGQDNCPRHRQRAGLKNDDLSAEDFRSFLGGFARNLKPHVSGDVYCVLGASEWPTLDLTLRDAGYHWSATIIWVKDAFVLGRSKLHRRYEPIWYGWHKDGKSSFCDRRDLDDVWEIPRPRRSEEHPTMKPVELMLRAITYSSKRGQVVVDLFGGSGSTLIAAEQCGRKAYLMELEPNYCDVIKTRWEQHTGKKAQRIEAGDMTEKTPAIHAEVVQGDKR